MFLLFSYLTARLVGGFFFFFTPWGRNTPKLPPRPDSVGGGRAKGAGGGVGVGFTSLGVPSAGR